MAGLKDADDGFAVNNLDAVDFGGTQDADAPLPCGTLPIDDDVGADVDDAGMTSDTDDSGACGDEKDMRNLTNAQLQYVPLEDRVAWLENEVVVMRSDVEKMKSRMADLIEVTNGMTAQPGNEGRSVVTAAAFEKMVDGALKSGMKYGVSRSYITRFVCAEFGQINNRYLQKKLGLLLKKKLTTKEYLLNDALYSINEK